MGCFHRRCRLSQWGLQHTVEACGYTLLHAILSGHGWRERSDSEATWKGWIVSAQNLSGLQILDRLEAQAEHRIIPISWSRLIFLFRLWWSSNQIR